MKICLEFGKDWSLPHGARITYAFRLFCAIYGHEPVLTNDGGSSADVCICYRSRRATGALKPALLLSNLYRPRLLRDPAPPPWKYAQGGEETVLFYQPLPGEEPDWLGEIFEWVSCADEYSIEQRDRSGRIPFSATYAGRHNLDIRIPYAAVAMRFLNRALCRLMPGAPMELLSPDPTALHFLVSTHDVDYFPVGRLSAVYRLAKNAVISCLLSKRPMLGISQAAMALRVAAGGQDPLDQIPFVAGEENDRGVGASYYFLPRHLDRRDANYTAQEPAVEAMMRRLQALGMEVGVHGSYRCLDDPQGLAEEYGLLREAGFRPEGGRQHWLRFTLDRLIPALERAGALYDTSIGWSDRIGFRAAACFAFPPYNFAEERPATFLEIPLAIMDQSLQEGFEAGTDWSREAASLLSVSRLYGWGGISLLWHPAAFEGGWLSSEVGETFWWLMDAAGQRRDTWSSACSFVHKVLPRYVEAGLLPAEKISSAEEVYVEPPHCTEAVELGRVS